MIQKSRNRLLTVILLLLFTMSVVAASRTPLTVSFIDVGRGDSILIQTPRRHVMLIDTGNNENASTGSDSEGSGSKGSSSSEGASPLIKYLQARHIKRIDVLVATLPSTDHIGGMADLIKTFRIGRVYMPEVYAKNQAFQDTALAIQAKGLKVETALAGEAVDFDPALTVKFLAPQRSNYQDLQDYSAVIKLSFGKVSFLFCSDAAKVSQQEMLRAGADLKADILKVSQYGGDAATSGEFLEAVSPAYAVITAGPADAESYPGQETLARLLKHSIKVFRTDRQGTVRFSTYGIKIRVQPEKPAVED